MMSPSNAFTYGLLSDNAPSTEKGESGSQSSPATCYQRLSLTMVLGVPRGLEGSLRGGTSQRVRKSPHAANPQFGEPECMSCTMRSWKSADFDRSSNDVMASGQEGPELVLRVSSASPNSCSMDGTINFSERFESFGTTARSNRRVYDMTEAPKPQPKPLSIPVQQIVVVDTHLSQKAPKYVLYITTISHGYFEFSFSQQNAHDCLVAFLAASLPSERIVVQESACGPIDTALSEGCSFDLDTFQADRIQERVKSETFSERMQRKMSRFAMVFEEMSSAISECACGGGEDESNFDSPPPARQLEEHQRRDSPPRQFLPTEMEFSHSNMDSSSVSYMSHVSTKLPSATRMEVEPELQSAI